MRRGHEEVEDFCRKVLHFSEKTDNFLQFIGYLWQNVVRPAYKRGASAGGNRGMWGKQRVLTIFFCAEPEKHATVRGSEVEDLWTMEQRAENK